MFVVWLTFNYFWFFKCPLKYLFYKLNININIKFYLNNFILIYIGISCKSRILTNAVDDRTLILMIL